MLEWTRHLRLLIPAALAALPVASIAGAQSSGDGYLFRAPRVSVTLRAGADGATARGDIYSFVTRQLTVDRGDFRAPAVGGDIAIRLAPRADVVLSGGYSRSDTRSQFRDFVGVDDLPIEQSTKLTRVPVTASLRGYLLPRGRSVGSLAWIPSQLSPYVAAGVGAIWYEFAQSGDFVDFNTLDIFFEEFASSGWAPAAQGALGLDFSLTPHLVVNGEAKYSWARATLGRDFVDFDRIDLSGVAATIGLSVRF